MTTRTRILPALLLCALMPLAALAADEPTAGTGEQPAPAEGTPASPKTGLTTKVAGTLQLGIAQGTIKYVNGVKVAPLKLRWPLLPASTEFSLAAIKGDTIDFVLRNDRLLDEKQWFRDLPTPERTGWFGKKPSDEEIELARQQGAVLNAEKGFNLEAWHNSFTEFWRDGARVDQWMRAGTINPNLYYAILREHQFIYLLLKSGGMGFIVRTGHVSEQTAELKRKVKKSIDGTRWRVSQVRYRIVRGRPAEPPRPATSDVYYYRFSIVADIPPVDLLLPQFEGEKITIDAVANWRTRKGDDPEQRLFRLGVQEEINFEGVEVSVKSPTKKPLDTPGEEEEDDNGDKPKSQTVADLNLGKGQKQLGEYVAKNFLGGSDATSIVSGPLLTPDSQSRLVGVNSEIEKLGFGMFRPGFILGVDATNTDRLFIGPSLRADAFTLGLGLQLREGDRSKRKTPGSGTFLKGDPALLLSADLSRLFGGKRQETELEVDRAQAGSDVGLSSTEVTKGLSGVRYSLKFDDQNAEKPWPRVKLLRTLQYTGRPLPEGEPSSVVQLRYQTETGLEGYHLHYLPVGRYQYVVPEGFELVRAGDTSAPVAGPVLVVPGRLSDIGGVVLRPKAAGG